MTLLEIVVRYPWSQMMHMMEPDTAGHPLQYRGELEIRTTSDRRRGVVPMLVILPVRILELMLNEEQPETRGECGIVRRQVDEQDARTEKRHKPSAHD